MKYTCLQDVTSFGEVMIPSGAVVEAGQRFTVSDVTVELSDFLLKDERFFEPLRVSVGSRAHNAESENDERDWIVEVKVRTTRSKLRAIEEFLSEELPGML